ncbi:transposable element tcb2 transposase [Trichonephila clavipes]|nr:transposable element tcb2 transposase [Trichonephila clavipes]
MGSLICLDMTLTGDKYVSIISDLMHLFMSIVHSNGIGEFQQDNSTSHTPKNVTEWLQEPSSELRYFRWSPESTNMNINECFTDALQRAV